MVAQVLHIGLHWLRIFFSSLHSKSPIISIPYWHRNHQIPLKYNKQLKWKGKIAFNIFFKAFSKGCLFADCPPSQECYPNSKSSYRWDWINCIMWGYWGNKWNTLHRLEKGFAVRFPGFKSLPPFLALGCWASYFTFLICSCLINEIRIRKPTWQNNSEFWPKPVFLFYCHESKFSVT